MIQGANAPTSHEKEWVGRMIADRYRVERILGVGGMGLVVAAQDLGLHRLVAIKLILPDPRNDDDSLAQRLIREARITARLEHRNIVRVYDFGEWEGRMFIVQEYLVGNTIAEEVELFPATPPQILTWMIGVLRPLAKAHSEKNPIIHRDVKPQNAFLAQEELEERVVLLDFGIAKETQASLTRSGITRANEVIGTGGYLSPEQTEGPDGLDARTDVWSAGVMLYELLTWEPLWQQKSWASLVTAILHAPIPDIRERARWPLPPGLAAVVDKALTRDRSKRFANAGEMLAALERVDVTEFVKESVLTGNRARGASLATSTRLAGSRRRPPAGTLLVPGTQVPPLSRVITESDTSLRKRTRRVINGACPRPSTCLASCRSPSTKRRWCASQSA